MSKLNPFRNSMPFGALLASALLAATAFAADPPRPEGITDLAGLLGRLVGGQSAIEINQARALAGGITAGDEPGFPVTITQAGSYILSGNLQVDSADTTAIVITSGGVHLDLNGFAIEGPVRCELRADKGAVCIPRGGGHGVALNYENRDGPAVPILGGKIHGGSIRGMGSDGISSYGLGGALDEARGWIVSAVTATGNGGSGIFLVSGTVENSILAGNGRDGIACRLCLVRNNQVYSNGGFGISSRFGNQVSGNLVSYNGMAGIASSDSLIRDNTVVENHGGGLISSGGDSILDNQFVSNVHPQLKITGKPTSWGGNNLRSNNLEEYPLELLQDPGDAFTSPMINQVAPNTCNGVACLGNDFGPIPF